MTCCINYCSLLCSRSDSSLWVLIDWDVMLGCGLYMYQRVVSSPVIFFAWVVLTMCLSSFLWLLHTCPLHSFHYLLCYMVGTCLYISCITLVWTSPSGQKTNFSAWISSTSVLSHIWLCTPERFSLSALLELLLRILLPTSLRLSRMLPMWRFRSFLYMTWVGYILVYSLLNPYNYQSMSILVLPGMPRRLIP